MNNSHLSLLFDDGAYTAVEPYLVSGEMPAAVEAGYGKVADVPVYAFLQHGAFDVAHCRKIQKVYALAQKTGCPVIGIYDADGVALNEGFDVLNAYGELLKTAARISGVVPQITVINGSCLGTAAVMANLSDIVIGVNGSEYYLTPNSDMKPEEAADNGIIDISCDTTAIAFDTVRQLLQYMPSNNLAPLPLVEYTPPVSAAYGNPEGIADEGSAVLLKAAYADEVCTCLASVSGIPVGMICFDGSPLNVKSVQQAQWMVRLCDAYQIPILTVADAVGCSSANEPQLIAALTKLVSDYASATCPKISLITKELTGAAYVALAGNGVNADITLAWDGAVAAPMNIDAAVAFRWHERLANGENRQLLETEYRSTLGSALTAAQAGAIDDVFAPACTRERITAALQMLLNKRETTIPRKHSVK